MIVAQLRGVKFYLRGRYMWPLGRDWDRAAKAVDECAEWLGFEGDGDATANYKYTKTLQRERENIFKRAK